MQLPLVEAVTRLGLGEELSLKEEIDYEENI
mgnify:CR=1 FL=1